MHTELWLHAALFGTALLVTAAAWPLCWLLSVELSYSAVLRAVALVLLPASRTLLPHAMSRSWFAVLRKAALSMLRRIAFNFSAWITQPRALSAPSPPPAATP